MRRKSDITFRAIPLTPGLSRILLRIVRGAGRAKEMAYDCGISEGTFKVYLSNLFKRCHMAGFKVDCRQDLLRIWYEATESERQAFIDRMGTQKYEVSFSESLSKLRTPSGQTEGPL